MESILLVVHVAIGLGAVFLIMIQQGKGAEMGASFGAGSSQTVFGAAGAGNFFSRMTGLLMTAFFATSIILAVMSKERVDDVAADIPVLEEISAPAAGNDPIPGSDDPIPTETLQTPESGNVPASDPVPAD